LIGLHGQMNFLFSSSSKSSYKSYKQSCEAVRQGKIYLSLSPDVKGNQVVSILASYSGIPVFKTRPGGGIFWDLSKFDSDFQAKADILSVRELESSGLYAV
jgi:hypothetical protein